MRTFAAIVFIAGMGLLIQASLDHSCQLYAVGAVLSAVGLLGVYK